MQPKIYTVWFFMIALIFFCRWLLLTSLCCKWNEDLLERLEDPINSFDLWSNLPLQQIFLWNIVFLSHSILNCDASEMLWSWITFSSFFFLRADLLQKDLPPEMLVRLENSLWSLEKITIFMCVYTIHSSIFSYNQPCTFTFAYLLSCILCMFWSWSAVYVP